MNLCFRALKCLMDISSLGLNTCTIKQITFKNIPFWVIEHLKHVSMFIKESIFFEKFHISNQKRKETFT